MVIAFGGVYPWAVMMNIIFSWWMYKVAMGFISTPLAYVGIKLLRDKQTA
jgi:uncharacterized PurR-regulated membrane protein YhhQ (DUF165 family)